MLIVQKMDGSYRMCVDYRALNKNTIKDRSPVQWIEDTFNMSQESESSYFNWIDLKIGYTRFELI